MSAASVTIEVDDGFSSGTPGWGVDHFAKIQPALNAAVNGVTTTVLVHPGTYKENLDFAGKALTLTSEDPAVPATVAATIIDGDTKGSAIAFDSAEANTSVVTGFTIRNGRAPLGGGIYCYNASPTITHNVIANNSALYTTTGGYGGGIYCEGAATVVISANTLSSNTASFWGGAITMLQSGGTIAGNTMTGNQATSGYGGGVLLTQSSSPLVDGNTIGTNLANLDGGGLWAGAGSAPTISGNTFNKNTSTTGSGGGIVLNGSSATVSGNTITENTAGASGAGIFVTGASTPQITGNTIRKNTIGATGQAGGGIACMASSQTTIADNDITLNKAITYGGGIYCTNAQATIRGNVIAANAALGYGGAILCQGTASVTIDGNTIHRNSATIKTGGIYVVAPVNATVVNCILWDNLTDDLFGVAATYSCIKDGDTGTGNIKTDPLFASPGYMNGSTWVFGDYHQKSLRGRWDPAANSGAGGWVADTVHSPCIDTGAPASPYANEPAPNGSRRNMGAFGNTAQASKSNVNTPPSAPSGPVPANAAADLPRTTDVSWTACTDFDGDALTYDVYIGNGSLPAAPASSSQSATTYEPGTLAPNATYYWKVVARDGHGGITSGPVWTFGTTNAAPSAPASPVPADAAADQMHNVHPSWAPSSDPDGDPVTYDVYFGKDALPGSPTVTGQTGATFNPGLLEPGAVYHWKIVAHDPYGAAMPGPEWTFATRTNAAPPVPSLPLPLDGGTGQYLSVNVAWGACTDPDGDPVTYDVYFGKDALPGTPTVTALAATAYDPGILELLSAYHWKVVAKDPFGGEADGPEWTFATGENTPPSAPSSPSPADASTGQAVNVDLAWAASTDPDDDPVTYDVYFGEDALPGVVTASDLAAPAYALPHLQPNATYHWRVIAKDSRGGQTPGPEWTFSTGADAVAPTVTIVYPLAADGVLTSDQVTVTGTADDSSPISAIWINGVRATPLSANYATWQAKVVLSQGWTEADPDADNAIVAAAVDELGNYAASADSEAVTCVGERGMVTDGSLAFTRMGVLVPGDADTFHFRAAAGSALTLTLTGSKGGPSCTAELYDPWGALILQRSGASVTLASTLPSSGLFTVRLLPPVSGSATYKLACAGKPPAVKKTANGTLASALDVGETSFTAQAGSTLALTVSSSAFQPALTLLNPAGIPMPLGGYAVSGNGKVTIKSMPLPDTGKPYECGDYVAQVRSGNGASGAYSAVIGVKVAKAAARTAQDAQLLGLSPKTSVAPGASLRLTVVGAESGVAANTVYLGGRALTPSSGSLNAGKGTLNVTVPADMPVGATSVYFTANCEKSNSLAVQIVP